MTSENFINRIQLTCNIYQWSEKQDLFLKNQSFPQITSASVSLYFFPMHQQFLLTSDLHNIHGFHTHSHKFWFSVRTTTADGHRDADQKFL